MIVPAILSTILAFVVINYRRQLKRLQTFSNTQEQIVLEQNKSLERQALNLRLAYQRIDELEERTARQHCQILDLLKRKRKSTAPLNEFYIIREAGFERIVPFYKN